jgi:chromosome segregation ATPase
MKEFEIIATTGNARDQHVVATEINMIKVQTNKIFLSSAVEIGKRLKEAKQMVGHGNWEDWLKNEVSYSQRTATNLIRIHDEYGPLLLENQIGNQVADLGYTQAVAMLKLDFEERENFIEENDVTGMSKRDLEAAIKEKNDILKEKEILEGRVKALIDNQTVLEQEIKEHSSETDQYETEIKNYKSQIEDMKKKVLEVDDLEKQLDESKSESADPELIKSLEEQLTKANAEAKALKTELQEKSQTIASYKPTEKIVEVIKEVEVVPFKTKVEIDALKRKLAASENTVKYKATFQVLVSLFDELINILNDIKATDTEEYEKYKGATNKLLEQLKQ